MSYHIPRTGEEVVFVDAEGALQTVHVMQVSDVQAGVVILPSGLYVRYVDPSGSRQHEKMTWHYASDDTSKITGETPEPIAPKVDRLPDYAKPYARRKRNVDPD